jgi:hypothetical protein
VGLRVRALEVAYVAVVMAAGCALDAEGIGTDDAGSDAPKLQDATTPREASSPDASDHDAPKGDGATKADGAVKDSGTKDALRDEGSQDEDEAESDAAEAATVDAEADAADAITYACPGSSVTFTDCSDCKNNTVGCVYCAGGGYVGECISSFDHCEDHVPKHDQMCPCDMDAAACIVSDQVCLPKGGKGGSLGCGTCGQQGSQGLACQGGGTCQESSGTCSP